MCEWLVFAKPPLSIYLHLQPSLIKSIQDLATQAQPINALSKSNSSTLNSSTFCEYCLKQVPSSKWDDHLLSVDHQITMGGLASASKKKKKKSNSNNMKNVDVSKSNNSGSSGM